MSTYKIPTKHPETGEYKMATWWDDYFGTHNYGVQFEGEKKVYRADDRKWETREYFTATTEYVEPKYNWFQRLIRFIFRIK